jgi:hypothetical protein
VLRTRREGDRWNLQTALIHLKHPQTGRKVRLMAMIHIGEPRFYMRVNEVIAEHDGLVLFEGVGQLTEEEIASLSDEERRVYEAIAPLHDAYRKLAAALDLVAQPDALTKPQANWRRADLPLKRLLHVWAERRLPLLPAMDMAGRALEGAIFKRATRLLLLQEPFILSAFKVVRGWSPQLGRLSRLLVDERNEAAIAVFDDTAAEQDILLLYGAGHVPGLLVALERRGYREVARDWFTAHTERIALTDLFDVAAGAWQWASGRPSNGSRRTGPPSGHGRGARRTPEGT